MASSYKVLGQARPASSTEQDLYTNPTNGQAVISTISIANTSGSNDSFRIFVRKDAAATTEGNAFAYDVLADAHSTTTITAGITIDGDDIITVSSSSGNLTFSAFGLEIS